MQFQEWVAVGDTHGDKIDRRADRLFRLHVEATWPKIRVHVGDFIDLRALRRGAGEAELRESMRADFEAGMEFLEWYRPTHLTLGNHDVRLWDARDRGGPLTDYADTLIEKFEKSVRRMGTRVYPYCKRKGVARIGRMKFAHGFYSGVTAARQMALAFGSVQFGHGHAIDVASTPSAERRAARMIGCLCQLDFQYNRAHVATLRQAHGWTYGPLFRDGTYQVFQAEVIGRSVVVAEGVKVLTA